jgi:endopolyphosphatase
VNATFKWIEENLKDTIDFVVWTGDSARHDSDEKIPRTQTEVISTNSFVAEKFLEVFSQNDDPRKRLEIPIVSTFGNNDILPHNILLSGPNKWLKTYTDIWSNFIPEEQRHGFQRGGWYYVEVIPNKLAVFSLNTLYFFNNNAAVDGCDLRSEPGYEHFEWLRIQLQFMRERGMKAILTGHVPPARTESKQLWDETCWQKYTLWLQQYRDVVVGGLYGHMNIDHFMLQDTKEISILADGDEVSTEQIIRTAMEEELSIQSASDYLEELRENWSSLPNPNPAKNMLNDEVSETKKTKKGKKSKEDKVMEKIGGRWGERFQVTHVGPSLVPNYFPTLRVIEYNITGLDTSITWASVQSHAFTNEKRSLEEESKSVLDIDHEVDNEEFTAEKKKDKKKKKKKPMNPDLIIPSPPTKKSPPGPAYSPQTLTMLGYTQYFANLTYINNDNSLKPDPEGEFEANRWREGKHKGKQPEDKKPHPKTFKFQVEYDTFTDPIYKLNDLTVRSYIKLAHRIGQYKPGKGDSIDEALSTDNSEEEEDVVEEDESKNYETEDKKKKKHKKKKHHKQDEKNKVWLSFVQRAFIGTLEEEELKTFQEEASKQLEVPVELHDGEL